MSRRMSQAIAGASTLLVLAGCGDSPAGSPASSPSAAAATTTAPAAQAVGVNDLNIYVLTTLRPTENRAISVGCENALEPRVGATTVCEVHTLNDKVLTVTVTATRVDGGVVAYEITNIA
jgi:esterase/lipase superfamily enzyme